MTSLADNLDQDPTAAYTAALGGARRVVVIGGYGCGNAGDEAILSVLLNEHALASRQVTVVSHDPVGTTRTHGARAVAAKPTELVGTLAQSDALVIGGGGIFSGYMGRRSMLLPVLAFTAVAARKRVLFRALGVYSSTPTPVGRLLATSMDRSDFVSVRDAASVAALHAFGLRRAPVVEPDPALRLGAQQFDGDIPPRSVGLALRRVRDQALQRRLAGIYAAVISGLAAQGRVPVLLPFSQHPSEHVEQDASYLRLLRDLSGVSSAVLLEGIGPAQLLGAIGSLDALIAMRFHSIVFGYLAGTPTLSVEYDEKCAAFARERSIPSIPLADVSVPSLATALSSLLPNVIAA